MLMPTQKIRLLVINVRAFSDDPSLVAKLAEEMLHGIQATGVAATLKHFPGHGDTDSHTGLPIVHHNWEQAWSIDLYPFEHIIKNANPALIMTAHIQYPALDDSKIYADKKRQYITAPATLSRKIQHDILRGTGAIGGKQALGFKGVTVIDALDMGAISDNFTNTTAVIDAFKAGDDIALMPVKITTEASKGKLAALINAVIKAVMDVARSANKNLMPQCYVSCD